MTPKINMDTLLDPVDQLAIARDALRGRASDFFRLSLMDPASNGGPERMSAMEEEIRSLQAHVKRIENNVG